MGYIRRWVQPMLSVSGDLCAGLNLCSHMHCYVALLRLVLHKKAPSLSRGLLGSTPTRQVSSPYNLGISCYQILLLGSLHADAFGGVQNGCHS